MGHRRTPGVEHGGDADACAEVPGIGGDRDHRLGRRPEQQVVNRPPCCAQAMSAISAGSGEDDVEVADRQQVGLARGQPVARRRALALGAMPVAAGVVGDAAWPQSSQAST